MRRMLSMVKDVPLLGLENNYSNKTFKRTTLKPNERKFHQETPIFLHCSRPRISKGAFPRGFAIIEHVCNNRFHIGLKHGCPHYHPIHDLQNLSHKFAHILLSKYHFGSNDHGIFMAQSIVFNPIGLEF